MDMVKSNKNRGSRASRAGLLVAPSSCENMIRQKGGHFTRYSSSIGFLIAGAVEHILTTLIEEGQKSTLARGCTTMTLQDVCIARDGNKDMASVFCNSSVASVRDVPVVGAVCLTGPEKKLRAQRIKEAAERMRESKASKVAKIVN